MVGLCERRWTSHATQIAIYCRAGLHAPGLLQDAARRFNVDLAAAAPQIVVRMGGGGRLGLEKAGSCRAGLAGSA
jgi:hypothetical protein